MCNGATSAIHTVQGHAFPKTLNGQRRAQVGKVWQYRLGHIVSYNTSVGLQQVLTSGHNGRYETPRVSSSGLGSFVVTCAGRGGALVAVHAPSRTGRLIRSSSTTKAWLGTVSSSARIHDILMVIVVTRHVRWKFVADFTQRRRREPINRSPIRSTIKMATAVVNR